MKCIYHFGISLWLYEWLRSDCIYRYIHMNTHNVIIVIVRSVVCLCFPLSTKIIAFCRLCCWIEFNFSMKRERKQQMWPLSNAMHFAFNVEYIFRCILLFCYSRFFSSVQHVRYAIFVHRKRARKRVRMSVCVCVCVAMAKGTRRYENPLINVCCTRISWHVFAHIIHRVCVCVHERATMRIVNCLGVWNIIKDDVASKECKERRKRKNRQIT